MKKLLLIIGLLGFLNPCFAQINIKDSVFVRIDQLKSSRLNYRPHKGEMMLIQVSIRNKYVNTAGFIVTDNSDLVLKNKKDTERKAVSYSAFNKMLNKDFINMWAHRSDQSCQNSF